MIACLVRLLLHTGLQMNQVHNKHWSSGRYANGPDLEPLRHILRRALAISTSTTSLSMTLDVRSRDGLTNFGPQYGSTSCVK
jgi:hypothetical protein